MSGGKNCNHPEYKEINFCTKSIYTGNVDKYGPNGTGAYRFANGVVYVGEFYDGEFYGSGFLKYPNGNRILVTCKNGRFVKMQLVFPDGTEFDAENINDDYVEQPFNCACLNCPPVSDKIFVPQGIGQDIPPGCYETKEGYFNPKTKAIHSKTNFKNLLRITTTAEEQWILKYCPKSTVNVSGALSSISCRIHPHFDYYNDKPSEN